MKRIIKRTVLALLIILFVFAPSEVVNEFYSNKNATPYPIQKDWGSMDFVLNGAHIKNNYGIIRPKVLHGIYITGWTAGSPRFKELINVAKSNGINTFVIDVKDASGYLSYDSNIPIAK